MIRFTRQSALAVPALSTNVLTAPRVAVSATSPITRVEAYGERDVGSQR
jgi:hypothetical protein